MSAHIVSIASDLGPCVQHDRGELWVETVRDPEAPSRAQRRARRTWLPDVLAGKGSIDTACHLACIRLVTSWECGVLGARAGGDMVFVDRSTNAAGPGDVQLDAATDALAAMAAVGRRLGEALEWCVLSTGTIQALAERKGISEHTARGYLVASIERLAEHYENMDQAKGQRRAVR